MKGTAPHEAISGFPELDVLAHDIDKRNRTFQRLDPLSSKTTSGFQMILSAQAFTHELIDELPICFALNFREQDFHDLA